MGARRTGVASMDCVPRGQLVPSCDPGGSPWSLVSLECVPTVVRHSVPSCAFLLLKFLHAHLEGCPLVDGVSAGQQRHALGDRVWRGSVSNPAHNYTVLPVWTGLQIQH